MRFIPEYAKSLTPLLCMMLLTSGCSDDKPTEPGVVEQLLIVSGDNQSGWANTQLPNPLVVKAATNSGRGVGNAVVVFQVVSSWRSDSTWTDTVVTDAAGLAQSSFRLDFNMGTDTVRATAVDLPAVPVSFTVVATSYWGERPPFALDPPPSGQGIQIVLGPFYVGPGSELQRNHFMKFPTDVDVDVVRVEFSYSPGSHHMNIYRNPQEELPDGIEDSFSGRFFVAPWQLVTNSQQTSLDLQLPPGVGMKFKANQQMNFQTHYVNASTQDTPDDYGMIYINFWTAQPGEVQSRLGVFVAFNTSIRLPPMQESSFAYGFTMSQEKFDAISFPINIFGLTGHFHSHGKQFTVIHSADDGGGGWNSGVHTNGVEVYRSEAWDEPPFVILDPPLSVNHSDVFEFTTTYVNDTDREIVFGPHVEYEEHANLFVYFYPSSSPDGDYINVSGQPK